MSIAIPAYNRPDLLRRCLEALHRSEGVTWEATVVDNASPDDLSAVRVDFPEVRWLREERNVGYAAANNLGLTGAAGRHFCYLNSDAEVEPKTLARLVAYLDAHPEAGAVTPVNVGPDGNRQETCSAEHTLVMAWLRDSGFHLLFPRARPFRGWTLAGLDWSRPQEVAHSQTTCLVIRTDVYRRVEGMDPTLFLFYNDVDFCRRLREAGWKIVYLPEARVVHHGSASVETAPWKERQLWRDRYRYFRKWYGWNGALGTRAACLHRLVTRLVAQVVTGRFGNMSRIWEEGAELYRALGREGDAR